MPNHFFAACRDEIIKIAGLSRSGRRPISAAKLVAKKGLKKVGDLIKLSKGGEAASMAARKMLKPAVGGAAVGIIGYNVARKANEDRRLGRQYRLAQQQQGQ